jgi:hypothetical protein
VKRAVVAALLATIAAAARADSPRWGSFEFAAGPYHPDIDAEFAGTTAPYARTLGGRGWMFRAGVSRALVSSYGALEAGVQTGYFRKSGKGLGETSGLPTGDDTKLHIIPTSLVLTYRFDFLAERYRIPLAPYGRAALERFNWWVTEGGGSRAESGATNGWSVAGGLALLLDFFDADLARELDRDSGVNHTYLYFEAKKSWIDDFGSSASWDMSEKNIAYSGGLLFVF